MTPAMLESQLALLDRIRLVERALSLDDQTKIVGELIRGHTHQLGNQVQIVKLASVELERRATPEQTELIRELRAAAEHATDSLAALFAEAQPEPRHAPGPAAIPVVRAAAERARAALPANLQLEVTAPERARTLATSDELEAIVYAALLDARAATRIVLTSRERTIDGKPWLELIRIDDRAFEIPSAFAPPSLLEVIQRIAERAEGEASISEGLEGPELVVALPVVA